MTSFSAGLVLTGTSVGAPTRGTGTHGVISDNVDVEAHESGGVGGFIAALRASIGRSGVHEVAFLSAVVGTRIAVGLAVGKELTWTVGIAAVVIRAGSTLDVLVSSVTVGMTRVEGYHAAYTEAVGAWSAEAARDPPTPVAARAAGEVHCDFAGVNSVRSKGQALAAAVVTVGTPVQGRAGVHAKRVSAVRGSDRTRVFDA